MTTRVVTIVSLYVVRLIDSVHYAVALACERSRFRRLAASVLTRVNVLLDKETVS